MSVESVVLVVPNEEQLAIGHVREQWSVGQHSEEDEKRRKSAAEDPMSGYDDIDRGYSMRGVTEWSHGMDE